MTCNECQIEPRDCFSCTMRAANARALAARNKPLPRNSVQKPADYTPSTTPLEWARQAIVTTYKGPTNASGARIVAKAQAGRIVVPYDHALDAYENHAAACRAYADRFAWSGEWVGGGTDAGYVWCNATR